jgi:hypothetical protein
MKRHCGHVDAYSLDPRHGSELVVPESVDRTKEPQALRWPDALEGPLEATLPAVAHFGDRDEPLAPGNDVELEPTQPQVARKHDKPAHDEVVGDGQLCPTTAPKGGGGSGHDEDDAFAALADYRTPCCGAKPQFLLAATHGGQGVFGSYSVPLLTQYAPVKPWSPAPIEVTSCWQWKPSGHVQ